MWWVSVVYQRNYKNGEHEISFVAYITHNRSSDGKKEWIITRAIRGNFGTCWPDRHEFNGYRDSWLHCKWIEYGFDYVCPQSNDEWLCINSFHNPCRHQSGQSLLSVICYLCCQLSDYFLFLFLQYAITYLYLAVIVGSGAFIGRYFYLLLTNNIICFFFWANLDIAIL